MARRDPGREFDTVEIPAEMKDAAEAARHELVELSVEQDDDALEAYLGGEEPDAETLKRCIRKGTVGGAFVPVLCGSAFKNKGVQPLLDAVVDYLPAPTDVAAIKGVKMGSDELVVRRCSDDEPFAGLAFKIMSDPFVGSLTFVRIYSGVLNTGSQVLNTVKNSRERIGRMLLMHANHREDIKEARAGDIVALAGLKNTTTGDTLSDPAIRSCWSAWNSRSRSSRSRSSRRPRATRKRWARRSPGSPPRTRHSGSRSTTRAARP